MNEKQSQGPIGSPEPRCQLLHRGFALLRLLLRAAQDVPQLLEVVQRSHQLAFHRLHLALQHLRVMEGVPPVSPARAHFFLQVLHCHGQPEGTVNTCSAFSKTQAHLKYEFEKRFWFVIQTHVLLEAHAICARLCLLFHQVLGLLHHPLHLDEFGGLSVAVPADFQ